MKFKHIFFSLLLLFALTLTTFAQTPKGELFVGETYGQEVGSGTSINIVGPEVGIGINFGNFGVLAEVSAQYSTVNSGVSTGIYDYVVGPKFAWHSSSRVTPFVFALVGGTTGAAKSTFSYFGTTTTITATASGFAFKGGVGADIGLGRVIAVRPQVEYSDHVISGSSAGTIIVAAGLVFRFGS